MSRQKEGCALRCFSIVVVEHPTEPLAPTDLAGGSHVSRIGQDEAVAESLVIAFNMIQVSNRVPILGKYETFVIHGILGMVAR
jgi:hypothetical protein